MLGYPDSNQDFLIQSQTYYRYTIAQCCAGEGNQTLFARLEVWSTIGMLHPQNFR